MISCMYFVVMQADGWIVKTISLLENPNQVRPSRFWGVYTKLKIFNMTNYKKGEFSICNLISSFPIQENFCREILSNI